MTTQAQKNKMFALAFADDEGGSFTQDSVSFDFNTLKERVLKEFKKDQSFGDIEQGADLEEIVDSGDPSVKVYRYEDETGENVLYAQIETVNIL